MNISNVLVVDDDITVCRIAHRMLSDERYKVQTSQSVADALRAVEKKRFDVYVLDYKLPDGSGLDVAERIRSKWGGGTIILISGYDTKPIALRAEKLGISDFLEKPFSRESICRLVKTAFDQLPAVAPEFEKDPIEEPLRLNFVPRRLAKIKRFWNRLQKVPGLHQ